MPNNKTCFTIIAIALALCCLVGCASAGASQQTTPSVSDTVSAINSNIELTDTQKSDQIAVACGWTEKLNLFTQAKQVTNEDTGVISMDYSGLNTAGIPDLYDFESGTLAYEKYTSNLAKVAKEVIDPSRENGAKSPARAPAKSVSEATITGTGTESDPYVIYTSDNLNEIASTWGSKWYSAWFKLDDSFPVTHFTLTKNLGTSSYPFIGVFNGNGKIISATFPDNGLFNLIQSSTVQKTVTTKDGSSVSGYTIIYDFTLKDCTLDTPNNWAGLLCDHITSKTVPVVVYNVDVSGGHVISASYNVGGLCGIGSYGTTSTQSVVKFSHCDVDKLYVCSSASHYVGGLCGAGADTNANVEFEVCTVKNSVVQAASYTVGGLCGYGAVTNANIVANGCTVENCRIVSTASHYVGGLCGIGAATNANGEYTDCSVVRCTISGTDNVGGIFGYFSGISATVTGCTVQDSCVLATSGKAYGICP